MKLIVIGHGGMQQSVERHILCWQAAFDEIEFISPANDSLFGQKGIGESCRYGPGAIQRIRRAVEIASKENMCCITEYDGVFKTGKLPDTGWPFAKLVCSMIFDNYDPAFTAPIYGHPPWIGSGESWRAILRNGDAFEGGWVDRWVSKAATKAGIGLLGMDAGYSYDAVWTDAIIKEATQAPYLVFHGVKTEIAFNAIMA